MKTTKQINIEMNIIEPDTIQVIDIYGDIKVIPINEVEDFNEEQRRLTEISINSHLA
tara:strand:- start:512 stop:682 length:171 start_codon:yes stop_codon:yes gene_type:complete